MKTEISYSFFDQQLLDEIQLSISLIDAMNDENLHDHVHKLRKSMKRMRGWLRAVRPDSKAKKYNQELSSIGKEISTLRDSTSSLEALERIRQKYGEWLAPALIFDLEKYLQDERKIICDKFRPRMSRVKNRLNDLQQDYEPFYVDDITDLFRGMGKTYETAKSLLNNCLEKYDQDTYHEWRKRTKDLQNQTLLFPDGNPFFLQLHAQFDALTSALGNDQDLHLLEECLLFSPLDPAARNIIAALLAKEHNEFQQQAFILGKDLYQDSPNSFIKKLATNHE